MLSGFQIFFNDYYYNSREISGCTLSEVAPLLFENRNTPLTAAKAAWNTASKRPDASLTNCIQTPIRTYFMAKRLLSNLLC